MCGMEICKQGWPEAAGLETNGHRWSSLYPLTASRLSGGVSWYRKIAHT